MVVRGNPYVAFLAFLSEILLQLGVVIVGGSVLGAAAGYAVSRATTRPVDRSLSRLLLWGGLLGTLGFTVGAATPLGPARVGLGVVAAAVGTFLAAVWSRLPDPQTVLNTVKRDDLVEIKLTITLLFGFYIGLRWWGIRTALVSGLSTTERQLVLYEASLFSTVIVVALFLALLVGLVGLTGLQVLWRWVVPQVEDSIATLEPEHREIVEQLEKPKMSHGKLVGSGVLVAGFVWLAVRGAPGGPDILEAILFGMAVLCLYMIVGALTDIRFMCDSGLADRFIRTRLKREGARLVTYLVTTFAGLVALVYAIDRALSLYFTFAMSRAPGLFSPEQLALFAGRDWTPGTIVDYYAFFSEHVIAALGVRLVALLFPVTLVVVVLPYVVKYLYFEGVRKALMVAATYVMFVVMAVIVNLVFSGEITHVGEIGIASILPTIGTSLSTRIVNWLLTETEYTECGSCHERVPRGASYCTNCGSEI